jgi:ElaB/YqjD/DUF883 family membrane-anchored ribosome-binding protein
MPNHEEHHMMETANNREPIPSGNEDSDSSSSRHTESLGDSLSDKFRETTHRVSEDVDQIWESVADAAEVLRNAAVECVRDIAFITRERMRTRPLAAIAAATTAGYVLARITGGRRR